MLLRIVAGLGMLCGATYDAFFCVSFPSLFIASKNGGKLSRRRRGIIITTFLKTNP